jgi:P4 family phage/plasmid primase-like protien
MVLPGRRRCSEIMGDSQDIVLKLPNDDEDLEEEYLKHVTLANDNHIILLNGEAKYRVHLPKNLASKRSSERIQIIKDCIMDGCDKYDLFYVSEDNVADLAKEVAQQTFERSNPRRNEEEEERLKNGEIKRGGEGKDDGKKKSIETKSEKIERLTNILENKYVFASIVPDAHIPGNARSNDPLYYYNKSKGIYLPAEGLVKSTLERLEPHVITDIVTNVIQKLSRRYPHYRPEFDADPNIINITSGLYHIKENKLTKHTPEYLSLNQKSSITYDPVKDKNKEPKKTLKFLNDVLYSEDVRTAIDSMAYTFYRDNPFQNYFTCVGIGRNGKSVLTGILEHMHPGTVSHVSMSSFKDDPRFSMADLEGMDVNIDVEMTSDKIRDLSIIKRITTATHRHRFERKGKDAYEGSLHVKLWFTTNKIPDTGDDSDGHFAREIIISFPYQFVENPDPKNPMQKKQDLKLLEKLTTQRETNAIFGLLMKSLRKVLRNGGIYQSAKTLHERREKSRWATNSIVAFRDDGVAEDSSGVDEISKTDLYDAYKGCCKFYHVHYETYENFCKMVKKGWDGSGVTLEKRVRVEGIDPKDGSATVERKLVWVGIKLTEFAERMMLEEQGKPMPPPPPPPTPPSVLL